MISTEQLLKKLQRINYPTPSAEERFFHATEGMANVIYTTSMFLAAVCGGIIAFAEAFR